MRTKAYSIRPWLALGLAWMREYTDELLPWLSLLPNPNYLPLVWNPNEMNRLIINTKAYLSLKRMIDDYQPALQYLPMLGIYIISFVLTNIILK